MAYLQFLGAAGTVTGSKYLINTRDDSSHQPGMQVLIDCGLFQGPKEWRLRNWEDTPISARDIDAVILTHAHLDHCGWIPRLAKEGFNGPIFATPPTMTRSLGFRYHGTVFEVFLASFSLGHSYSRFRTPGFRQTFIVLAMNPPFF